MCIQRKKAADAGIIFRATFINIHDGVDEKEGEFSPLLYSDEQRIMQVLLNLQSNALKFTPKGKVEILVSIKDSKLLEISVVDTGVGIKEED